MAKISLDTTSDTRGIKRFNEELAKSEKELEEVAKASRGVTGQKRKWEEMVDPVKKLDREMAKLALSTKKHGLSQEVAEKAAAKLQQRYDRIGSSGRQAFGARALGDIKAMAAGFFGLSAAVNGVQAAFRSLEQEAQASADAIFNSLDSLGALQQLAVGDPAKLGQLTGVANKLITSGAISPTNRKLAYDTAFSFDSAGLSEQDIATVTALGAQKLIPAAGLSDFAGKSRKIQDIFGQGEAGTLGDVIDKVLAASKQAQSDAPTIAGEIAKFGGLAASLGFTDEASIAAFLASEKQSDTPAAASERMKSLFAQVKKRGLGKGTLAETLDSIQGRVAGGEKIFDILGEQNAVIGFEDVMRRRDIFDTQSAAMLGASGTAARSAGLLASNPEAAAAQARSLSAGKLEGARIASETSNAENLLQAILDEMKASNIQSGYGFLNPVAQAQAGVQDFFGQERSFIAREVNRSYISEDLRSVLKEYLDRTAPAGRQE